MKKQILIIATVAVLLILGLSGCFSADNGEGPKAYTLTHSELISDLTFIDNFPTLQSYEEGDTITIYDTVLNASYDEQNDKTMVTFYYGSFGQYFLDGNQVSKYSVGENAKIETTVQRITSVPSFYEGTTPDNALWLDNWYENAYYHYVTGIVAP